MGRRMSIPEMAQPQAEAVAPQKSSFSAQDQKALDDWKGLAQALGAAPGRAWDWFTNTLAAPPADKSKPEPRERAKAAGRELLERQGNMSRGLQFQQVQAAAVAARSRLEAQRERARAMGVGEKEIQSNLADSEAQVQELERQAAAGPQGVVPAGARTYTEDELQAMPSLADGNRPHQPGWRPAGMPPSSPAAPVVPPGGGAGKGGKVGGGGGAAPVVPATPSARQARDDGAAPASDRTRREDAALKELRDGIDKIQGRHKVDLSPLMALTDAWTGSNLTQSYQRPMSQEQRDLTAQDLRAKLLGTENAIEDKRDNRAYLNRQLDQQERRWDGDRDLREKLGMSRARAFSAGRGVGSGSGSSGKVIQQYINFLTGKGKGAVSEIARARFGKRDENGQMARESRATKAQELATAQDLAEYAHYLETTGQADPGRGLRVAIDDFQSMPRGPDGAGGTLDEVGNGGGG